MEVALATLDEADGGEIIAEGVWISMADKQQQTTSKLLWIRRTVMEMLRDRGTWGDRRRGWRSEERRL